MLARISASSAAGGRLIALQRRYFSRELRAQFANRLFSSAGNGDHADRGIFRLSAYIALHRGILSARKWRLSLIW